MMKKLLSILMVLFLSLTIINVNGSGYEDKVIPLKIVDVYINGNNMNNIDVLQVERGEKLRIKIKVESNEDIDDIKIDARVPGFEWDNVDGSTEMFNMAAGATYSKYLTLDIPEDMDAEEFTLRIKVYNRDFERRDSYTLRIEANRYSVIIKDVMFTPGLNVNVGQPLFVTVRVENMGYQKEEDVKVSVSIPQLGKYQATYIDELSAIEDSEDEETSDSSDTLYIDTKGASAGTYDLIVKVEYANGHEEVTKNYQLVIDGVSAGAQDVLIDVTETSKSAIVGEGIVYSISIANMRSNAGTFTAEISGLDWANFRVDPIMTTVQAGSSGEMFVYVSPKEGVTGQKAFTVTIKEGNNIVKQFNFQANIIEDSSWGGVLTGLEIGFVVLLIILVILGIVLAATRMGKKDDEEPLGETYY